MPIPLGHGIICVLSLRFARCGPHNKEDVEGDCLPSPPPGPSLKRSILTSYQNIDWCYIFYALQYQLAAILLATNPRWFLYQALGSNFLWILPWAIVVTKVKMSQEHAWTYYSIIFGGALVFDFFDVGIVVLFWAWRLMKGKITLRRVHSTL